MDADVVVIGAGYAGLAAADRLIELGLRPLILEARPRVGGRTLTEISHGGVWLDLGGQWIGPGQDHIYRLARRFSRRIWPMYTSGRQVIELQGTLKAYRGLIPWNVSPSVLIHLVWALYRLDWLASKIPIEEPWKAAKAAWLDQRTLGDWLRSNVRHRDARSVMQVAIEAVFASHPDDIGLLHGLWYLKSGGGFERLTSSAGGAQQDRIDGGLQALAEDWCQWLRNEQHVDVLLDTPVLAVRQHPSAIEVITSNQTYRCHQAIVAVPPALAAEIEFFPPMPPDRLEWCTAMRPGQVIKGFAFYPSPFWREKGLNGQAVSDRPPVHVAFDATPPDCPFGILLGFIEGRQATHWSRLAVADRQQVMIEAFARFFGRDALEPVAYVDHDWTVERWSRGCYAGVPGPGVTTSVASAARVPHGRVHWAGTETATHWNGYIEGAIRSGLRAAEEIGRV